MNAAFAHCAPAYTRRARLRCSCACRPPPVRSGRISHALVLEQASAALRAQRGARLTVDFPPERSEARSGTLVARYENNLNFAERLLRELTDGAPQARVGGTVNIRDNINPQGGGEYLDDDECMTGVRARGVAVLLNAGVDAGTLRQLREFDDEKIVLVNCALDRLSWFDKRALRGAVDAFETAYYCKVVAGAGVLMYDDARVWTAFVPAADGTFDVALEAKQKPNMADVERAVRLAVARKR